MRKKIWRTKIAAIIGMAVMGMALGMTGCGKASVGESQETSADTAQSSEVESKEKAQQAEKVAEPTPTPEPTPQPTPEEEKIELPEIDERYEYHLYCSDKAEDPVIGLNALEGWKVYEPATRNGLAIQWSLSETIGEGRFNDYSVACEHYVGYYDASPLETNEQAIIPRIVLELEEKAIVDTAFGKAEIYWVSTAYQNDDTYDIFKSVEEYKDRVYEKDGKKYVIENEEVAVISIGRDQTKEIIFFECSYNGSYRGTFERTIAQMLEPK